jgi:UDP-2,3-diacylglucosamine pyrophosphatase LpxH
MKEIWITSDVYLGARQCLASWFLAFLRNIPPHVSLVLNGDVMTRLRGEASLPVSHIEVLDAIRAISLRQAVIWVGGNHDRKFRLSGEHSIQFVTEYPVSSELYVVHGDRFDHLSHSLRFLLLPLRIGYEFCTRVVGSRTHVTDFAKLFPGLYEVLNGHVLRNATKYAHANGFKAVVCGHTHHPGVREHSGVRYYNTGCWTERGAHVLVVRNHESIDLCPVLPDGKVATGV